MPNTTTTQLIFEQGPYFVLLILFGYVFYKFLDRTHTDHVSRMDSIKKTFLSAVKSK